LFFQLLALSPNTAVTAASLLDEIRPASLDTYGTPRRGSTLDIG
jgi:hypothetical protein